MFQTSWQVNRIILSLSGIILCVGCTDAGMSSSIESVPSPSPPELHYETRSVADSMVHSLRIPKQGAWTVTVAVADPLQTVAEFAQRQPAIAVLNAGFFDPENGLSTSFVTVKGQQAADPRRNDRLIQNPNLKPYLKQILNRSEFRRYNCGQTTRYDIVPHQAPVPPDCQLLDAVGGGPQLLPTLNSEAEAFSDPASNRDPIGINSPNARTAIGVTGKGDLILLMVAQNPRASKPSGLSLRSIADLLKTLGAEKALNLDGGSSSSLYYKGKTIYGKVDSEGNPVSRPIKSVLVVTKAQK
jgi:Phosphodiester glycosidase